LVSSPKNYSDADIIQLLAEYGLDFLGQSFVDRVRRQTVRPVPFRPYDLEHVASQHFLDKHRVRGLFYPNEHTRCAFGILEVPKMKEFVEAMLVGGAPPALISRAATRISADACITDDGVRVFHHFFWNTDLLDFTDVRAVIDMRGGDGGSPNSVEHYYQRAHRKDSRKVAAELPFSPLSAMNAQMRMGITPTGIRFAELMDRTRTVAGLKAYQNVMEDNRWSAENARHYITVAQAATDLYERSHKPEELLLEKFNALQLETDPTPIPHIMMLSEGNHTVDVQPVEVRTEVVEVDDEG
jgi:hypothetical protein